MVDCEKKTLTLDFQGEREKRINRKKGRRFGRILLPRCVCEGSLNSHALSSLLIDARRYYGAESAAAPIRVIRESTILDMPRGVVPFLDRSSVGEPCGGR